jgi:hypothetical protein
MFLPPFTVILKFFVFVAIVGMSAGAVTGLLASVLLKITIRTPAVVIDGFLGLLGSLFGFIGTLFVPWPEYTVSYENNGVIETTTMSGYQHPWRVALTVAIALPLVHQLFRRKRAKST